MLTVFHVYHYFKTFVLDGTMLSIYLSHATSLLINSSCANPNCNPNTNVPKFSQLFSNPQSIFPKIS